MKKQLALGLLAAAVLAFSGCGNSAASQETSTATAETQENAAVQQSTKEAEAEAEVAETAEEPATQEEEPAENTGDTPENGSNVLVVYFSRTGEQYTVGVIDKGNTEIVAEMIAEETGADMFEVLPQEDYYPYTYSELTDVAKQEQNDNARPAYAGEVPDLSRYDTIFIGAPVWWGDWPMIMYTFFENNQDGLSGKTLIPFSTHEGSGLSGFDNRLSSACRDSTIGEGLAIRGNDCQNNRDSVRDRVSGWLSGLGY